MSKNIKQSQIDGVGVSPPLTLDGYPDDALDGQHPMNSQTIDPFANGAKGHTQAGTIQWRWWALGLVLSLSLWVGLAKAFGWF